MYLDEGTWIKSNAEIRMLTWHILPCAYWTKRIIIDTLLSISQQKTIYDATSPPQGFRLRIRRKDNHDKDDNDSLSRSSSSHCRHEKSLKSKVNNPQTHSRLQSVRYTPQSLTAHPWKNHGWKDDPFPSGKQIFRGKLLNFQGFSANAIKGDEWLQACLLTGHVFEADKIPRSAP